MAGNVMAQETKEAAEPGLLNLDAIVVTAAKYEKLLKDVPQSVTVIDAEELEKKSGKTLGEILQDVVGLQVQRYGAIGSQSSVSLRGMTSSQVLVLIDGRPINKFQDGLVDLSMIPVNNIASIEIVRGAASSLYGSNAMGGVINIITKKEAQNSVKISYGTFNTFHNEVTVSNKLNDYTYTITASKDSSDGDRPNSAFEAKNINWYNGFKVSDETSIDLKMGFYDSKLGTPGATTFMDYDDKQFDTKYYGDMEISLPHGLTMKSYINYNNMEFEEDTANKATHENRDSGAEIRMSRDFGGSNHIVIGAEYHDYDLESSEIGERSTFLASGYLQDEIKFKDKALLTIGGRHDSYKGTDDEFSSFAALLFYLTADTTFRLSVGESFRVPTFNDLYWPSTAWAEGNPNLTPEKGISSDLGIDMQVSNRLWVRVSGFYSDVEDLINWAPGNDSIWRPYNIKSAIIKGLEMELKAKLSKYVTAEIGYTLLDTEDEDTKKDIIYRPKNKIDAKLDMTVEKTSFTFSLNHVGKRYHNDPDINGDRIRLDKYTVYNAKLSHKFSDTTKVYLKGENIFDKEYVYQRDYPMPGIAFYGGMEVLF
jgi:outer membrane cobalamin receptor